MAWKAKRQLVSGSDDVLRFKLVYHDRVMCWSEVLQGWSEAPDFADFFSELLTSGPFEAFRWETPGLVSSSLAAPFECVLVADDGLRRRADSSSFEHHFDESGGIVRFHNLGGDAELIVPGPTRDKGNDYAHFGDFLRTAPTAQTRNLWRTVAAAVTDRVGMKPMWLSTAGAGVPWLHVRLDDRPKYYAHRPYRDIPTV